MMPDGSNVIRIEVSKTISDIKNLIASFAVFSSNYDDEHYDMFLEALTAFSSSLDQLASYTTLSLSERDLVKNFLKSQCLPACETLRTYEEGRRNFLKVDYDIALASNQAVEQVNNMNQSLEQPMTEQIPDQSNQQANSESLGEQTLGRQRVMTTSPNNHHVIPVPVEDISQQTESESMGEQQGRQKIISIARNNITPIGQIQNQAASQ